MKYRKLPVVIEAIQLNWSNWGDIVHFVGTEVFGGGVYLDDLTYEVLPEFSCSKTLGLYINTLEGKMLARHNDYIIKGVNGEFYPCKPDIFEKTYEPVTAPKLIGGI